MMSWCPLVKGVTLWGNPLIQAIVIEKKIKKYKTCNDVILFSVKTQDTCQFYSCQEKSCKWFNTTDIGIQQAIQSNILFKVVNSSILWYFVSFKQNIAEFK